eukprot:TRINITY_DN43703_c0_g1_i1.p1 TRINITY_DN43703_c0_g1~~TRINITY_DN43703_c0_g1_i1.p1  ORF type:complete len:408 (-),score=54.33 TRINITY_DN43703_c0_g1_i1:58-1281(-)
MWPVKRGEKTSPRGLHEAREVSGAALDARAGIYFFAKTNYPRPERTRTRQHCAHDQPAAEQQPELPGEDCTSQQKSAYHSRLLKQSAGCEEIEESCSRIEYMCNRGLRPDNGSFNAFVALLARHGRLEEAEDWLRRPLAPSLHPALGGVEPSEVSYNALLTAFGQRMDLPRAERYATEMLGLGIHIDARSFGSLIEACLSEKDVRRAHHWAEVMVQAGQNKPNKAMMVSLVCSLAETGNVRSASHWLSFMESMKVPLGADVYELVQAKTPLEVVPTGLSGEGVPCKPMFRPATAGGCLPPISPPRPVIMEDSFGSATEVLCLDASLSSTKGTSALRPQRRSPRSPQLSPRCSQGIPRVLVAQGGAILKVMGCRASEWGQPTPRKQAPKSVTATRWLEETAVRNDLPV